MMRLSVSRITGVFFCLAVMDFGSNVIEQAGAEEPQVAFARDVMPILS